jgi:hypothetical protein
VYGIHNNHDHINEGEKVKGDRGWEKGEGGRMERGGRKMRDPVLYMYDQARMLKK